MDTYENNGVCQYLSGKANDIFLTDLTKSMIIIADKKTQTPLTLVLDDRVDNIDSDIDEKENETIEIGKCISDKSRLPFFIIRYVDGEDNSFNERDLMVGRYVPGENTDVEYVKSDIQYFVNNLTQCGIPASLENRSPQKEKNDKLSSDFHLWQRECLRVGIFTDIDMIRYDKENREILRIYELKRSKESFEEWKPYYKEIFNYRILANFCELLSIQFYIVFNGQKKKNSKIKILNKYYYKVMKKDGKEFYDDVTQLRIFLMCKPIGGNVSGLVPIEAEHITIDHFIDSDKVGILKEKYWNMKGQENDAYFKKEKDICYCDPLEQYDEIHQGQKSYHSYADCEWLNQNASIKTLYKYEAHAEGYKWLCKKCKDRANDNI